jgi:hypothetical protein
LETAFNDAVDRMQSDPEVVKIFNLPQCFSSPNGLQRCVETDSPYFPPNWVSKTHNGYSTLVQNFIVSCRRYAADILTHKDDITKATSTSNDFWYVYEIPLMEGEGGINMAFRSAKDTFEADLKNGVIAASASYAVGLGASFIIFIWVFGSVRKSLQTESKYNRGVLFMVPHDILRNSKAMIEYIEQLYTGLGL